VPRRSLEVPPGMAWKEMVVMEEQTLEAQSVATLRVGARRKMRQTCEAVERKMAIDDPNALSPPPPPSSLGPPPGPASAASTLFLSTGDVRFITSTVSGLDIYLTI